MSKIKVTYVVGLVNIEDLQPGWEIRRKGAWCTVSRVDQLGAADLFLWNVYVREYVKPMEFVTGSTVLVMALVEGVEGPPFLPKVPTIKQADMVFPGSTAEQFDSRPTSG